MSRLRKSAKGKPCFVRIPRICNFDESTTVLAHLGGAGMGIKSHDLHGAFCCSSCHDAIDGRIKTPYRREELKLMHYDGVKRTQDYWLSSGYVVTKNLT